MGSVIIGAIRLGRSVAGATAENPSGEFRSEKQAGQSTADLVRAGGRVTPTQAAFGQGAHRLGHLSRRFQLAPWGGLPQQAQVNGLGFRQRVAVQGYHEISLPIDVSTVLLLYQFLPKPIIYQL